MRRLHKWLVGISVGALLAAAEGAAGQVAESNGSADRADEVAAQSPIDASSFWAVLGDPALERVIELAIAGNHDLEAAAARVDGAKASRLHASLELAPIVTANAGYARRRFSSYAFPGGGSSAFPDQDVWDAGLSAAWEIDAFG